jgi:hypothetical protein
MRRWTWSTHGQAVSIGAVLEQNIVAFDQLADIQGKEGEEELFNYWKREK